MNMNANSDILDTIPDHELSEIFAVEVAGTLRRETPREGGIRAYSVVRTGAWREIHEGKFRPDDFVEYAESADAVLAFLQEWYCEANYYCGAEGARPGWRIKKEGCPMVGGTAEGTGFAQRFARAACIALIRAKRATPK